MTLILFLHPSPQPDQADWMSVPYVIIHPSRLCYTEIAEIISAE